MYKTIQTVEVPEEVLDQAMRRAQTDSPQEAIVKALEEYAHSSRQRLIDLLGKSDTFMSLEELLESRSQK